MIRDLYFQSEHDGMIIPFRITISTKIPKEDEEKFLQEASLQMTKENGWTALTKNEYILYSGEKISDDEI